MNFSANMNKDSFWLHDVSNLVGTTGARVALELRSEHSASGSAGHRRRRRLYLAAAKAALLASLKPED